jgi:methylation protein EvaC
MEQLNSCRICASSDLLRVIDLHNQPLANKYPTTDQFATEDFYPLVVMYCLECKCVQLNTIIDRSRMFVDYYYLSSVNQGLVRHFNALAKHIATLRPKLVIDIGSNDGILLQPLTDLKIKAIGIEPSENVSQIAMQKGLMTYVGFFNQEAVETIERSAGKADVIVASSVFTHLEDPSTFVKDVNTLLSENGTFIVEVEYIKNIIESTQFERFYFDRIFYYSLQSLVTLFKAQGLKIIDAEIIDTHGGSLRVSAVNEFSNFKPSDRFYKLLNDEDDFNSSTIFEFKREVERQSDILLARLGEFKSKGLKVVGYGAPARVATICNYLGINSNHIEYIIDDSKLKQDRYSPGTHIPIYPYTKYKEDEQHIDVVIVFAWEYLDDIKKKTPGVTYIIPIPYKEIKSNELKPLPPPPPKKIDTSKIVDSVLDISLDEVDMKSSPIEETEDEEEPEEPEELEEPKEKIDEPPVDPSVAQHLSNMETYKK